MGSNLLKFDKPWTTEIASISTQPLFQNAVIRIEDPELVTRDYNIDTATWSYVGDPVVYPVGDEDGRARIIFPRAGVFSGGESQANATTINAVRIQVPHEVFRRIKRGLKVFVEECDENPSLIGRLFAITSDLQGSNSAARTFEASADVDAFIPEPDDG